MRPFITVALQWSKFGRLTDARDAFPHQACVYVQADPQGKPVRIGRASKGLNERYHGGNGGAMEAAMHASGNLIFIAPVEMTVCVSVEEELIWQRRRVLTYNVRGKSLPPARRVVVIHVGDIPDFAGFDVFAPPGE